MWNSLPQKVVEAKMTDFKNKLYIALGAKEIKGYRGKADQDIEFDDQS